MAFDPEMRVLLAAATARDAEITRSLLAAEGLACMVCPTLDQLTAEIVGGVGAILLTEEAFGARGIDQFLAAIARQPPWSDIPVVILMRGDRDAPAASQVLQQLTNVTLLERPAPMRSVISAVQAAVRGRERQYQIRLQIQAIQEGLIEQRRMMQERDEILNSERAARSEAEKAARLKDEFLATLSHELRTPLHAILGWSQILRRIKPVNGELDEGLSAIERNARIQAQLIGDLLDMSRIISGKLHIETTQVDLDDITSAAMESVRPAADARDIHLQKISDKPVGPVRGDAARLQQVVWNLLSNAIKFTPKGGQVQVGLRQVRGQMELSVTDSGMGIKPEFLPFIFDRFRQADASTTRKHGGLGLGLAIVKNLVELHGGSVRASSAGDGCGTTFVVELPIMAAPATHAVTGLPRGAQGTGRGNVICADDALQGISVLIVEDEEDARKLIARVLEECQARVMVASSGPEGRQILSRERPAVLVSDIGMPDEDGYEFIRKVRLLSEQNGGRTPAAALTAFARSEDRTRALLAGYQTHITKPVEPAELVAVVASLAGRKNVGA